MFRGVVADSVRGLEFLLTRPEVDAARVIVAGNDIALITAGLAAGATHVVATPALFYRTAELAPKTQAYPLEEINDYVRLYPARAESVRRTLTCFDLGGFAPHVTAATLLMAGAPGTLLDGAGAAASGHGVAWHRPCSTSLSNRSTRTACTPSAGWPHSAGSRTCRASSRSTGATSAGC